MKINQGYDYDGAQKRPARDVTQGPQDPNQRQAYASRQLLLSQQTISA
jgi:hypothetical protein